MDNHPAHFYISTDETWNPILTAFWAQEGAHDNPQGVHEHGQQFVCCFACGGQWSVDAEEDGVSFECLTQPDGSCDPS